MSEPDEALFPVVRWREGYDIAEVNRFLSDVLAALEGPLPDEALAARIERSRFTPRRVRTSYDMKAVDEALDDLLELASRPRPTT